LQESFPSSFLTLLVRCACSGCLWQLHRHPSMGGTTVVLLWVSQ
jgi:hypothetical protein